MSSIEEAQGSYKVYLAIKSWRVSSVVQEMEFNTTKAKR